MNKSVTRYGEKLVPDYSQLAEAGRASGLLVFGHDHVGHGRSGGERGQVRVRQEFNTEVFFCSFQTLEITQSRCCRIVKR